MKSRIVLALLIVTFFSFNNCRPSGQGSVNEEQPNCRSIKRTPIPSGTGTTTLCVTPTQCREDEMAKLVSDSFCAEKTDETGRVCNRDCASGHCVGVTTNSALIVTSVSWDREKKCASPTGTNECTAKWEIPAGKTVECGCDCK